MANLQAAGNKTRGVLERVMGIFGPLSSLILAGAIYAVFWEGFVRYVPDLSTPEAAMYEVFLAGVIALGYLIVQMLALVSRHTGRVWAEVADLFFSLFPLVILIIVINDHWPLSSLTSYEYSVVVLFMMATVADVLVVTVSAFKLLLMANDMFISN